MRVYVGSFIEQGTATGIRVFEMEPSSGALTLTQTAIDAGNAFYLTLDPRRPVLYSVDAATGFQGNSGGAVSAFALEPATGRLTLLNRQFSHGTVPCYASVDLTGGYLLVANYGSGSVAAFPLEADGRLGQATDVVQHVGRGPQGRQEGPHAHFVAPDPTGDHILACDLGADRIVVYRLDATTGRLVPNEQPYVQANPGAGPRHLAFHPAGRHGYVINELDSTITAFSYDAACGVMEQTQTVSTLPDGFVGDNYPAHVMVGPSGRFVYGSNRGHDSIPVFAVDQQTGQLTPAGHAPAQGRTPWHFAIDPKGAFLLVANQKSDCIIAFKIDRDSGALEATGHGAELPAPTCVQFGRT